MRAGRRDAGFLLGAGLADAVTWIGGTAAGRLAGSHVPDPTAWGFDFAPTAIFVALLASLWRGRVDVAPWLSTTIIAVAVHEIIPGPWYVPLGVFAGVTTGMLLGKVTHVF